MPPLPAVVSSSSNALLGTITVVSLEHIRSLPRYTKALAVMADSVAAAAGGGSDEVNAFHV